MAKEKYEYKLHPKYEKKTFLGAVVNVDGVKERVNLVGNDETITKTIKGKEVKFTYKKATQKHLAAYYESSLQANDYTSQKVVQRIKVGGNTDSTT